MEIFQYMEFLVLNHVEIPVEIQDMEIFQNMEGLVLNCVEISVETQDMEILSDMEIFHYLETQHHTQYIVKPPEKENNYINKYINYILTYFNKSC